VAEPHIDNLTPTATVPATIVGASATPGYRAVEIRLVATDAGVACNFWLGLAKKGADSPARLMDYKDIGVLFTEAATSGVNEQGPLILSDTSSDPARFVFLMPVPDKEATARKKWVDEVMSTLVSWSPAAAGIYIAPQLLSGTNAEDLLRDVLRRLVAGGKTDEIFLFVGSHGQNALLNVALGLKADLDGDDVKLFVFH
jgi:hypothetical protein